MNMTNQETVAVAPSAPHAAEPARPRKSRSRFAHIFDMTDDRERHVCRCLSDFHRGKGYTSVALRRAVQMHKEQPHRVVLDLVDMSPPLRDRGRWMIITWGIDRAAIWYEYPPTKKAALAILRSAAAR